MAGSVDTAGEKRAKGSLFVTCPVKMITTREVSLPWPRYSSYDRLLLSVFILGLMIIFALGRCQQVWSRWLMRSQGKVLCDARLEAGNLELQLLGDEGAFTCPHRKQ